MVYIGLFFGFLILVKGADFFVSGASGMARVWKIPGIIIGLTIVAFGTSAPEAAVSITAALKGNNDIALGNVIGSNIFNLLVVAGISAVIIPMPVSGKFIKRDLPVSIAAAVLLGSFCWLAGMSLTRISGIALLLCFAAYMYFTVYASLQEQKKEKKKKESLPLMEKKVMSNIIMAVLGLVCIIAGGQLVVAEASAIARQFGISENLIGLTIVAVGTSLPELVTSIAAARKGENDIAMGNILGSNIFNILFILGMSASLHPIAVSAESLIDTALLVAVSSVLLLFLGVKKRIGRGMGISMVLAYIIYMGYVIIR